MLSGRCRPAPVPSCAGSSDALWRWCCAKKVCTATWNAVSSSPGGPQQCWSHSTIRTSLTSQTRAHQIQEPPRSVHRVKSTEPTQSHGECVKIHVCRTIHSSSSPAGDFSCREQQSWILIVCVWRGTSLRSAASPYYCYSKCRSPCLSCRLAVPNQYSPGTDLSDRPTNNIFFYYFFLLISQRDGNYMCATTWTVPALNQNFLLSVLIKFMKFYLTVWNLCPHFWIALVN